MLVEEGFNGRLVASDDVSAFTAALQELCADEGVRATLGANSLKKVQQFSLSHMVDTTEDVYGTSPRLRPGWLESETKSTGATCVTTSVVSVPMDHRV
jgi:hypothetical protein